MKIFVWIGLISLSLLHASSYETLRQTAIAEKKLLWIFIETENCGYCQKMRKEIITSGLFQKELSSMYVFVPLNGDEAKKEGFEALFFPTSYIIQPHNKKLIDQFLGYVEPEHFAQVLTRMYKMVAD